MAWRKLTALTAAAIGAFVLLATPALAAAPVDQPITLNPAHKGQTAAGFGTKNCTGPLDNLPAGKDGWHFILPSATGEDFKSVDLEFDPQAGPNVLVIVDNVAPGTPDSGPGYVAFFAATGSGAYKHLFVITDAGWTLVDGDGVAIRDDTKDYNKTTFNLSHTCPSETPPCVENCEPPCTVNCGPPPCTENCGPPPCDPAIDECTPPRTPTPSPSLPATGNGVGSASVGSIAAVGAALVVGGVAITLLLARRRRDEPTTPGSTE